MKQLRFLSHVALTVIATGTATATTYVVRPDGTGDFPTIQTAIHAAADGDIIELTDGTFTGDGNRDIDFEGKAVQVRSQSGNPAGCIIDSQGSQADPHRGFLFVSSEGSDATVRGIRLTGADITGSLENGGAIFCEGTSTPSICECLFDGNQALYGAAIFCGGMSSPSIRDCLFHSNTTGGLAGGGYGAGIACADHASPQVTSCDFLHNSSYWAGALHTEGSSSIQIESCLFARNGSLLLGGAMILDGAAATIRGCTFVGNSTETNIAAISCGSGCQVVFENTIVAFSVNAASIHCADPEAIMLTCCDIYGNSGGDWIGGISDDYGTLGNISEDPLFCDPDNDDFGLRSDSPCMPHSPPNEECPLIGARPLGCPTSSAPEGQSRTTTTWGLIRAGYR